MFLIKEIPVAQFMIPPRYHPGILRHGRIYKCGERIELENGQDASLPLIPLDADAYGLLVSTYGADVVVKEHGKGPKQPEPEAPPVDNGVTLRQMDSEARSLPQLPAEKHKGKSKGRASDR